ncbi:hypothetical protein [Nitratifractor sp.]|uniref:hypothetical protein n=1 Tax=Nitratifractor sp. TaxID=2268144 RepID=UPI0025E2F7A3|nr:hypothetical protein [Nitratifractor sp.]
MIRYLLGLLLIFLAGATPLSAQTEYRYSYVPKQLYAGQVFPVTILETDADPLHPPTFRFDPKAPVHPLEKRPLKVGNGKDLFYTFYFKAGRKDFHLPDLYIQAANQTLRLPGRLIPVEELSAPPEERFCGVIASDFKIKTSQVSTFDDKNNLIYLNIEAHEANLEDMAIPGVVEGGVEKLRRKGSLAIGEYYFVIPANVNEITFSYYNAIKQQFIPLKVSTAYQHKQVAAQVDLNPKDSSFTKLKKYTFGALSLFFLLMFIFYRDFFYLILLAVAVLIFITFFTPMKKICVQEGAPLYILPIASSTVGTTVDRDVKLPVLHRYHHYYKVEYKHGITGWIKDEDLCKD